MCGESTAITQVVEERTRALEGKVGGAQHYWKKRLSHDESVALHLVKISARSHCRSLFINCRKCDQHRIEFSAALLNMSS